MKNLKTLFANKKGQSSMEYILIFILVVVVVIGGLALFGANMNKSLTTQTAVIEQNTNNALCAQKDSTKPIWGGTANTSWVATDCKAVTAN